MFDTMTLIKSAAAFVGALLFLLLVSWAAGSIYDMSVATNEDGEPVQAYTIEVEDSGSASAEPEEEVDFDALLADADAAAGEKQFGKCRACHSVDGKDGTGPHLNGVVDREIASVSGFAYSDAMVAHADDYDGWTPEALYHFLTSPKAEVPGTKMVFAGFKKPQDIADLVTYLEGTN